MPHWDLLLPLTAVVMLLESQLSGSVLMVTVDRAEHTVYNSPARQKNYSFLHIPAREEYNTSVVCELIVHDSNSVLSTELSAQAVLRVQGMMS